MASGTVKSVVAERGFGFVAQEGSEGDLFFHASAVRGATFEELRVGQRVEFDVEPDPGGRGGRAIHLRPAGAAGGDRGAARADGEADPEGEPAAGSFTVRYESEQQLQEGLEGVSGGTWSLRGITRLPDGAAVAEFTTGDGALVER